MLDVEQLEGWLVKKNTNTGMFSVSESRRWFKVREVKGSDQSELALCYFKAVRDKDARGWIYVRDITEISNTIKTFTIISPSRTLEIETSNSAEQKLWVLGMMALCPHANVDKCTFKLPKGLVPEAKYSTDAKNVSKYEEDEYLNQNTRSEPKNNGGRKISKMDRNNDNDDHDCELNNNNNDDDKESNRRKDRHDDNHASSSKSLIPGPKVSLTEGRSDRDDHRMNAHRASNNGSNATSRLHNAIRGESEEKEVIPVTMKFPLQTNAVMPNSPFQDLETFDLNKVVPKRRVRPNRANRDIDDEEDDKEYSDEEDNYKGKENEHEIINEKNNKAPPPTTAPPRRASDALAEVSARKLPTIDDLLTKRTTASFDERDDSNIDFKAEKDLRRSNSRGNNINDDADAKSTTKPPPRPPQSIKPPYAQKAKTPPLMANNNNRASTPPRKPVDPGSAIDSNFVNDNWDESPEKVKKTSATIVHGVSADSNWLNDDFDD